MPINNERKNEIIFCDVTAAHDEKDENIHSYWIAYTGFSDLFSDPVTTLTFKVKEDFCEYQSDSAYYSDFVSTNDVCISYWCMHDIIKIILSFFEKNKTCSFGL
jgi:hypothetical protein